MHKKIRFFGKQQIEMTIFGFKGNTINNSKVFP